MEENTFTLPEDVFGKGNGAYQGENYQLTIRGETGYLWFKLRPIPVNQDVVMSFNLTGSLPVACCAAEMDARNIPLIENDAVIEIKSVQRKNGLVRVIYRRNAAANSNLSVAIGVTFAIEAN